MCQSRGLHSSYQVRKCSLGPMLEAMDHFIRQSMAPLPVLSGGHAIGLIFTNGHLPIQVTMAPPASLEMMEQLDSFSSLLSEHQKVR